jgi:hypothetical protein
MRSVLAEPVLGGGLSADRILHELPITLAAEVETTALVNILSHQFTLFVLQALQNLVDLQEVVAIVANLVNVRRINHALNLHTDDVTHVINRIDDSLAAITRVVNHPEALPESTNFGGGV